jgi:predicted transcriptional regulator
MGDSQHMPSGQELLLSVRPGFAEMILARVKTVELRRRLPKQPFDRVWIYSTAPVQAVVGFATVSSLIERPLAELWRLVSRRCCVPQPHFDSYFAGLAVGGALEIATAQRVEPTSLRCLQHAQPNWRPPQSYRYVSSSWASALLLSPRQVETGQFRPSLVE